MPNKSVFFLQYYKVIQNPICNYCKNMGESNTFLTYSLRSKGHRLVCDRHNKSNTVYKNSVFNGFTLSPKELADYFYFWINCKLVK
jgi:hypothetical protein